MFYLSGERQPEREKSWGATEGNCLGQGTVDDNGIVKELSKSVVHFYVHCMWTSTINSEQQQSHIETDQIGSFIYS